MTWHPPPKMPKWSWMYSLRAQYDSALWIQRLVLQAALQHSIVVILRVQSTWNKVNKQCHQLVSGCMTSYRCTLKKSAAHRKLETLAAWTGPRDVALGSSGRCRCSWQLVWLSFQHSLTVSHFSMSPAPVERPRELGELGIQELQNKNRSTSRVS